MLNKDIDKVRPTRTIEIRPIFERPDDRVRKIIWTPFAGTGTDIFIRRHPPIAEVPDEAVFKPHWTTPFREFAQGVGNVMRHWNKAMTEGDYAVYTV